MDLNDRFLSFIEEWVPDTRNGSYLLAVSGGIDSMCMLELFHSNGFSISLAHCNFLLRGEESDADQEFVEERAISLGVPVFTRKFNTKEYARSNGISTQMAARELRYEWFSELMSENGSDYLCTAHHLDDSIETALFNMIKGTGISGMAGIRPLRDKLLRPLLGVGRKEIEEFAREQGVHWREDSSNNSEDYSRNYIRHRIIPLLKEINPSFPENHSSTMSRLRAANSASRKWLSGQLEQLVSEGPEGSRMSLQMLSDLDPDEGRLVLFEWLSYYGYNFSTVEDVYQSLRSEPGVRFLSGEFELVKDRDHLILTRLEGSIEELLIPDGKSAKFAIGEREFSAEVVDKTDWILERDESVIQLDMDELKFPLRVRLWENGDYFYPLGLGGKKKISDFMIDRKIPVNFKRQVLLLLSGTEVAAVLGMAVDDRFKVTDKTRQVFIIRIEHA